MTDSVPALPSGTVTFLFTDIEGSTERWEQHREAMVAALARHDALLRGAIEARGGYVFKTVGDAFCAAFATADGALGAALDAQRAIAAEDWTAFGVGFPPLRVRMGLHTGVAEERGGDYFGPPVNRVARLEAAGHGGQVLLSLAAQQLVRDALPAGCGLLDRGEHRLKDLRYSEHIFQLVGPDLPDIAASLRTADALRPRDRIVVADPDVADADRSKSRSASAPASSPEGLWTRLTSAVTAEAGSAETVRLSSAEAAALARAKAGTLSEWRLGRIAEWSQPRYRLDGRFVDLTLLVDQGEEAVGGRWVAEQERYDGLGILLTAVEEPAVVVLGSPGSGKSTLLRHLELDLAIAGLRGEGERVTFFIQLNQYRGTEPGEAPPSPERWLSQRWSAANPDLPSLETFLGEGRMILLLDGLNEMPAPNERDFRERVGLWKDWLVRLAKEQPGNRVVFSCRTLDYSAPLSTPALRVPQVQIEPLANEQVRDFLRAYSPVRWEGVWAAIAGTPQIEALRAPFFLALLVDQVEATGDLSEDRAGLFTGFVRQALKREVERGNPLFALEELLSSRDLRRVAQSQWRDAYELPERGVLVPRLSAMAYGMQESEADGGASQVRVDYDTALALVDHPRDEAIVDAGVAISVLDEDPAADEVLYRHQLLQEYFAARILARAPKPELVAASWRAVEIRPSVRELLETLPPAETLAPLPTTGWEETTLLAAAMAPVPEAFLGGVMATNLVLAGRAAVQPRVRERLSAGFLDELRWALVERSRDREADLRARIAAGLAAGALGDPRFERREGPHGAYLMPPLVAIPGGEYPIGDDEPIEWSMPDLSGIEAGHMPRHTVGIAPFAIGQFPVTNAEWAWFMAAGGFEDERWWDTEDGRRWQCGEMANEGAKANNRHWRKRFQDDRALFEQMVEEGRFPSVETVERWRGWMALDDAAFEAALDAQWQAQRQTEPAFWHDERFNHPAQPVVGISWYEARAYCQWLSTQTGRAARLPMEVEWESAARGTAGRRFAWGEVEDPTWGNVYETRIKRTTPVGVFVEGDTPEGASDMSGNVFEWTSSLWGEDYEMPAFPYPYNQRDGREAIDAGPLVLRVGRGGSWGGPARVAWCASRGWFGPGARDLFVGFRVAVAPLA